MSDSLWPNGPSCQASLFFTISWLLFFSCAVLSNSLWTHGLQHTRLPCSSLSPEICIATEAMMPSNHLILCCHLLLPSVFLSIRVFSNELALHIRWPKYWSFSFSISPSNEYSGLISFRIDWFDFLAVQGTLEDLLQHHNSKALILWCLVFLMVQLSHPYMATGKTIAWPHGCLLANSNRVMIIWDIPGSASGKEPTSQCRRLKRLRFVLRLGKILWRWAQQPTLVFLPGESHGQWSLVGDSA